MNTWETVAAPTFDLLSTCHSLLATCHLPLAVPIQAQDSPRSVYVPSPLGETVTTLAALAVADKYGL